MSQQPIDYERLFKLRLTVGRHGEMDAARWWNTQGILGPRGAIVLKRGFPSTHRFAQARIVFEVARSRTVSGLVKILHPHGDVGREDLAEILELALEGRRRVKEQLKKMGSFEYHQTSFGHQVNDTGEEKFVGVPEQGGKDLISPDPLARGTMYCAAVSGDGTVGWYRIEMTLSSGSGKLKPAGGVSGAMKESIKRAFTYLLANKNTLGVGREVDTSDFHVEVIDLLGNKVEAELGVAFFIAAYSALRKAPPQPGLLVLGDMSVQGNVKAVRSLTEPLQVAMDNGAKRALIPIENKRQFLEVNPDVLEHVNPIFYGALRQAAFKALGLN